MKKLILEIIVLLVSSSYQTSAETTTLPPEQIVLPLCFRDDPLLAECIMNATISLKDQLLNGIPELKIPSLNPLSLPTIKLQQTTKSVDFKAVLTDVKLYGLTDYEFFDIMTNIDNLTINMSAVFHHVYIDTEYMLMGIYEDLPIEGSGRMMANFSQNVANIKLYGAIVKRKGDEYLVNKDIVVSVKVGEAETDFENLYTGGDVRSQITDHIIKMHSEDVLQQLKPAVENVISIIVDDITTKFFKSFPYDKLLPEENGQN